MASGGWILHLESLSECPWSVGPRWMRPLSSWGSLGWDRAEDIHTTCAERRGETPQILQKNLDSKELKGLDLSRESHELSREVIK